MPPERSQPCVTMMATCGLKSRVAQPFALEVQRRNRKRHTSWWVAEAGFGRGLVTSECAPYPVLASAHRLASPIGLPEAPQGLAGVAKPLPGRDHSISELALQVGGEVVGQRAAQPAAPTHGTRSLAWGGPANLVCLLLTFAFLPGPACGLWGPAGLGANPSSAPIWLRGVGQVAPLSLPQCPLPERAPESICLKSLMGRVESICLISLMGRVEELNVGEALHNARAYYGCSNGSCCCCRYHCCLWEGGSPVALRPHKHGHVKAAGMEGKVLEKGPPGYLTVTQKTLFISTLGSEKALGKLNFMISVHELPAFVYALLALCASVSFPSVLPFFVVFFWYTFKNVNLLQMYNLGPEELVHYHQSQPLSPMPTP